MEYSIFTPFLCGAIGYATNWLAIKMIFRPYEEKRIFGVRIPFTPSLMAKEKNNMANKIGDVVSSQLITDDIFLDFLKDDKTRGFLTEKVKYNIDMQQDKSIFEFLTNITNNDRIVDELINCVYGKISKDDIAKTIADESYKILVSEEFFVNSKKLLRDNANTLIKDFIQMLKSDTFSKTLKEEFVNFSNKIDDKSFTIEDILGHKEKEDIYTFIEENLSIVLENFIKLITSEKFEPIDDELEKLVKVAIASNLGSFASAFIKPEIIYSKNKTNLIEYLRSDNNIPEILQYTRKILDNFFSIDFLNVINSFPEDKVNLCIEKGLEVSATKVVPNLETPFYVFLDKMVYDGKVLDKVFTNLEIKEKIYSFVLTKYDFYFYKIFNKDFLKTLHIKDFIKDEEILIENLLNLIYLAVENNVKDIIKNLNIDKIIEKNIKDMPLMETEKIVLNVAGRELKAITYFGGVLGFIVGAIPVLLSKF